MGMFNSNDGDPGQEAENVASINNAGSSARDAANNTARSSEQYQGAYLAGKQAESNFGYQKSINDSNNGLARYLGDQGNQTQRYGIDANNATTRQGNQLQYQASVLPANLKQQRFNQVLPMFQDAFGRMGQWGGGTSGYKGNGQVGTQPNITTGGVYSQGQIQQQVNAGHAQTDQQTGTNVQNMNNQLGGKGYGSGSPLAMALQQNYEGQGMAANANNERETRMTAAQQNAGQTLNSQQAAEGQFANRQNEDIERNKVRTTALSSWLGSLGSIIG